MNGIHFTFRLVRKSWQLTLQSKRICHLLQFETISSKGNSMWWLHSCSRLLQSIRCQPLKVMAIESTISQTRCIRNWNTHYKKKRVLPFILMVLSILLIRARRAYKKVVLMTLASCFRFRKNIKNVGFLQLITIDWQNVQLKMFWDKLSWIK